MYQTENIKIILNKESLKSASNYYTLQMCYLKTSFEQKQDKTRMTLILTYKCKQSKWTIWISLSSRWRCDIIICASNIFIHCSNKLLFMYKQCRKLNIYIDYRSCCVTTLHIIKITLKTLSHIHTFIENVSSSVLVSQIRGWKVFLI